MTTRLRMPAATVERLTIPDIEVTGIADPTDCAVHTCLSTDATTDREPAPDTGWELAAWLDTTTISTHRITGLAADRYGLWVRITGVDDGHLTGETVILYAGSVELI